VGLVMDDEYDKYSEDEGGEEEESETSASIDDETIKDRLSTLISTALGNDYEENYIFENEQDISNNNFDENDENDYLFREVIEVPTKITVHDKLRFNKQKHQQNHQQNTQNHTSRNNENENNEHGNDDIFQVGNVVVSEAKAKLLGLSIKDLNKKFNNKKEINENNILPNPKNDVINLNHLNKKNTSSSNSSNINNKNNKNLIYSKESDRKHCIFKPKEKSYARKSAAKAAGFENAGNNNIISNDKSGGGGGFNMGKKETIKDIELEKEKLFIRRQDVLLNNKRNELKRLQLESSYENDVIESDKLKCPICGQIQSYDEIIKKEKKCRGEYCNGALYTRGITFDAASFLKRQEEHLIKSELQLKKLKENAEENERKTLHSKPINYYHDDHHHKNNNDVSTKMNSTNTQNVSTTQQKKKHYETDIHTNDDSKVMRDLRTPRYLSREKQQNSEDHNKRKSNSKTKSNQHEGNNFKNDNNMGRNGYVNERNHSSNEKYFGNHSSSDLHEYDNARNCDIQMMQHLERLVGTKGCDDKAKNFVTDTYNDMMDSKQKNKTNNYNQQQQQRYRTTKSKLPDTSSVSSTSTSQYHGGGNHAIKSSTKVMIQDKMFKKGESCNINVSSTSSVVSSSTTAKKVNYNNGSGQVHQQLRRTSSVRGVDPWADLLV
jgi:hypothetical protein